MTPEQALLAIIIIEQALIFYLLRELPQVVADKIRRARTSSSPQEGT